jgi:antitoxin VapB
MAARIPKELAFADDIQEVEIERIGNTLVVRPV